MSAGKSFMDDNTELEELKIKGGEVFLKMYGGNQEDSLMSLR